MLKSEVLSNPGGVQSARLVKDYTQTVTGPKYVLSSEGLPVSGEAKIELENGPTASKVKVSAGSATNAPAAEVLIGVLGTDGDDSGVQQLVTKSWVMNLFNSHVHPTAAVGPPSPPMPMPDVTVPHLPVSNFTSILKAE